MKLYDLDNNEFEVKIHERITSKLKADFIDIIKDFEQDELTLQKQEVIFSFADGKEDYKKLYELARTQKSFNPEIEKKNDLVMIKCLQLIINKKDIEQDKLNLINSKPEGDFWSNQDLIQIKAEVNGFCSKLAI